MDDILIQYRDEVLGKPVWMKFPVEDATGNGNKFVFFEGLITECKAYLPNRDPNDSREYEHFVYFGDTDDGYYNLADQDATGYLKWSREEADKAMEEESKNGPTLAAATVAAPTMASPGTPATATSTSTSASTAPSSARVVTPTKRNSSSNSQQSNKRVKVKQEFGSTTSNIHDPSNNEINLREFEDWLRRVHTGAKGGNISQSNGNSVMNRVRDLISKERGIKYKNWPADVQFHAGESVTLDTDFHEMMMRAHKYEETYGEDKGHGWLLRHPIKKLQLFAQYVEEKRNERANPTVLF